MAEIIEPGETTPRWLNYNSPGVDLTGATILVGLGGYSTEPSVWETPVAVDTSNAVNGVLRASIGAWGTRTAGDFWGWTEVTLSGAVDIVIAKNERFRILAA